MKRILALAVFCTLTTAHGDLTNGLVAFYPFSGNANDASGNGHNGVVNGATLTFDRFGNANRAYSFAGWNSYIRVAQPIISANPFTWTAWVKGKASSVNSVKGNILVQAGNPATYYCSPSLWLDPYGQFTFYSWDDGLGVQQIFSGVPSFYDTNQWYSVVGSSDAQGNRCLYVNGVCKATGTNQAFGQQLGNFYIGGNVADMQDWFLGAIDDVRVYNRALSATEVEQLYEQESGPRVIFVKAFTLDCSGLTIGSNYQLQASSDLSTWTNYGASFSATSVNYTNTSYQRIDNWAKLFFRLQTVP